MAPDSGTCWAMVSCTSPVPGGMSMTSTSSSPQSTSRSIWVSAETTIGPRQMIGVPSSTRKPIDMALRPKASMGRSVLPLRHLRPAGEAQQARLRGAVDVGVEDAGLEPDRLQAERQVDGRRRLADAALAGGHRDHVLDAGDLGDMAAPGARRGRLCRSRCRPTHAAGPRLPHPGALRHLRAARRRRAAAARSAASPPSARRSRPSRPSISRTTFSAAWRSGSSSSARSAGTVIENETRPSLSRISETSPRSTMLPSMSGPLTRRSVDDLVLRNGHQRSS